MMQNALSLFMGFGRVYDRGQGASHQQHLPEEVSMNAGTSSSRQLSMSSRVMLTFPEMRSAGGVPAACITAATCSTRQQSYSAPNGQGVTRARLNSRDTTYTRANCLQPPHTQSVKKETAKHMNTNK